MRSLDIFLTKSGDVLRTEGLPTRTPIPGAPPGEFTSHVDLDIKGGWGKYEGAYGTLEYDGLSHTLAVPPTTDFVYKGTVCGPNIKGDDRTERPSSRGPYELPTSNFQLPKDSESIV